ncbi:MAG: 4Fe-4S dicluster domain-containing protein [Candidatus Cloacimonetes bacterium]|nr:4Fe-4S dicluster domain-containing protein [Candidatus Cloacimonadota bacterium]
MNKMITITGDRDAYMKAMFSKLLKEDVISAVFSLRRLKNGVVDYGLTSCLEDLENIEPFYPLMPANAGQLLSRFTPLKKPLAAIIKPCEFRAFVEMAKRQQGSLDNFLIFTYGCGGVYPLLDNVHHRIDEKLADYWQAWNDQDIPAGVRESCTGCEHLYAEESDVYLNITAKSELEIYVQTEKAAELLSNHLKERKDGVFNAAVLEGLIQKRAAAKEKMFAAVDTSESGLDGLIDIFGRCIGCHGCNSVCPICYCVLCDFDSFNYDYNRPILEKELEQKGALRLPPDTLFFHLGRLSHMSFSCVGCGMCSDVCPADIPVASVFKRTGEKTAAMFNFIAGRSVKEEIPVMIYKEEEFPELGE